MFNVVVDYVEKYAAHQALLSKNLKIDIFLHKYFPTIFGKKRASLLGLSYINSTIIKELYLWYKNEYALYSSEELEPEHIFIDKDNNPTNKMFSVINNQVIINDYHPEYYNYLDRIKIKQKVIDEQLLKLIAVRDFMI